MVKEAISMHCPNCGAPLTSADNCEYCNTQFVNNEKPKVVVVVQPQQEQYQQPRYEQPQAIYDQTLMPYNKWVAFILCFFFGILGVHYFYVGRWGMGLIYLLTLGLCGIGIIFDLVRILIGIFPDKYGRQLR